MNINVVKLSLNRNRLPSVVRRVAFQLPLVACSWRCRASSNFCYVFRHLSGSHPLFVADSLQTTVTSPSMNRSNASGAKKTCRSNRPSPCFLSLLEKVNKISRGKSILSSLDVVGSQCVSRKYLTPSSAFRDSRLRSPFTRFCNSEISLFFSAGPRWLTSSTVRSSQSSISSSYLNQELDPSKSCGKASSKSVISVVELWTMPNQRNLGYNKILFFWNNLLDRYRQQVS